MQQFLVRTSHRPRPLPSGRWAMTQRWNDLLFAHWPVSASSIALLLPDGLEPDTYQGSAWLGITPFWVDRVKLRGLPPIPGGRSFPGLNMRTYVRDRQTGAPGIFLLSLDTNDLLAVLLGRALLHVPYHWAEMKLEQRREREFSLYSNRRFAEGQVLFKARYRGLGPARRLAEMRAGTLESFLIERHYLYRRDRNGKCVRSAMHHVTWPLEDAEAEIERNDLPSTLGIRLPKVEPVLYYARRMAVYLWRPDVALPEGSRRRIPAQVMPLAQMSAPAARLRADS